MTWSGAQVRSQGARVALGALFGLVFVGQAAVAGLKPVSTEADEFYGYMDSATCTEWAKPSAISEAKFVRDELRVVGGAKVYVGVADKAASAHRGGGHANWRLPTMAEWLSFNRSISWCSEICLAIYPPQQIPESFANQAYWTSEASGSIAAAAMATVGSEAIKNWLHRVGVSAKVWPVRTADGCDAKR